MKIIFATAALSVMVVVLFVPHMTLKKVGCVQDLMQEELQSHFEYFEGNPVMREYLLILFGLLTDFLLIVFLL